MNVPFVICDVFTDTRFGGNPLAVITDARGVSDADMQRIAREFGFSETTFVLPPDEASPGGADDGTAATADDGATHRVRIFTPTTELPFAGHPNVGTAFALALRSGDDAPDTFRFREGAGLVDVTVERDGDGIVCELRAPEPFHVGDEIDLARVADAVGLDVADLSTAVHAPRFASVGLPFAIAELVDRAALARARPDPSAFARIGRPLGERAVLLYHRDGESAIDCRMFFEHVVVAEDPATGSANGALAGLLASLGPVRDGELRFTSRQGDDMGRPSRIALRARVDGGRVTDVFVGGRSVLVAEGRLQLDG